MELNDKFYASPGLVQHAKNVIRYLDRSISFLESNSTEDLADVLLELGQKHATLGVTSRMYQPMGQALISTVAEVMGEKDFTPDVLEAWINFYQALVGGMMQAS